MSTRLLAPESLGALRLVSTPMPPEPAAGPVLRGSRSNLSHLTRMARSPGLARAILRGIRDDALRVRVGAESFVVDWLKRSMPIGFHKLVAERIRVPGS
jgi:hypothetical protein